MYTIKGGALATFKPTHAMWFATVSLATLAPEQKKTKRGRLQLVAHCYLLSIGTQRLRRWGTRSAAEVSTMSIGVC